MAFLVHQLFERAAARHPDQIAIVDRDLRLTYGELDRQSAGLATWLRELGVQRGDRIGIYAKKTWQSVVALYGILRAGAAYVPLDAGAPPSRIGYTIENAGISVLVTTRALGAGLPADAAARISTMLYVDDGPAVGHRSSFDARTATPVPPTAVLEQSVDTDLAYVLYTSGSTGVPKGVAIDHRASMTFLTWAIRRFALGTADRVTSHAPLHFDLSTFDVLASLGAGATVVLVPEGTATFPSRFVQLLASERITVSYLVPSALSMMIEHGNVAAHDLTPLRAVLFAGEVLPLKYLRAWLDRLPDARFYNLYGPTETNVCTYLEVDRQDARTRTEPLSIGGPIDNVDAFVVAEDGSAVRDEGGIGELWVRGAGLARGYLGDPERTAKGFVASPLHREVHEPAYRTGDRVQIEPGGRSYRFLGRIDHMVKTRGYRVELGEIESVLVSHPAVASAAAIAFPDEIVGNVLRAYVSLADGARVAPGELARLCAERLPRYMIPETIDVVAKMPLTSSGKIDRSALAAGVGPDARDEEAAE